MHDGKAYSDKNFPFVRDALKIYCGVEDARNRNMEQLVLVCKILLLFKFHESPDFLAIWFTTMDRKRCLDEFLADVSEEDLETALAKKRSVMVGTRSNAECECTTKRIHRSIEHAIG